MKNYRNYLAENFILPLSDALTGQSILKHFNFLQKSQWWSKDQLIKYQEHRLHKLIKHSVETVPYYKDLFKSQKLSFEDIRSIEDLTMIPILNKEIIRKEGIDRFISSAIPLNQRLIKSSSGSTGEPLTYYITKDAYSFIIAANLRGWYWMGYRLGDKLVKVSNSERNAFKKIQDYFSNNKCIVFKTPNEAKLLEIIQEINSYKPKVLRAYNAPLAMIINTAIKTRTELFKPEAINTTGSVLHAEFRAQIESFFGCKVFDSYSCEGVANVFECHTHECYHSTMEYGITEILYDKSEDEKFGHLISTDLWNLATPFIRYDSKDFVEILENECSCGKHLLPIKRIIGRDADILLTPQREKINPHTVSIFFNQLKNVEQFQVIQEELKEFKIYIQLKDSRFDETANKIKIFWERTFGADCNLTIHSVNQIPISKSGKRRYISRSEKLKL